MLGEHATLSLMRSAFLIVLPVCLYAADPTFRDVSGWAKSGKVDELRKLLTDEKLGKGSARFDFGPDFLFAVETKSKPQIVVNDEAPRGMTRAKGSDIWYTTATLKTSRTHNYHYLIGGKPFGGQNDVPAWGPYAYPMPNVPQGKLDGKHVHESRIYPGMKCDYWIYVPAQYDANTPAPVMVWQDGEVFVPRELPYRSQIIWDNLTHLKKIPAVIHILISPGYVGSTRIRSEQYDMMDDKYVRFLRDEILAEVGKKYKLRQDSYSRAIGGDSSGGICAFNAAYTHPELFSRVLSRIGSFTSIQWKPGVIDGGNVYPYKIRKEPKRNMRVWLQEGSEDLENDHGSWPATNIALANSLKLKEYDFHLSWGNGTHSRMGGNVEMADELIWLWRGYDPAKTNDTFTMDPAEKDKPFFRVKSLNRETPLP